MLNFTTKTRITITNGTTYFDAYTAKGTDVWPDNYPNASIPDLAEIIANAEQLGYSITITPLTD